MKHSVANVILIEEMSKVKVISRSFHICSSRGGSGTEDVVVVKMEAVAVVVAKVVGGVRAVTAPSTAYDMRWKERWQE